MQNSGHEQKPNPYKRRPTKTKKSTDSSPQQDKRLQKNPAPTPIYPFRSSGMIPFILGGPANCTIHQINEGRPAKSGHEQRTGHRNGREGPRPQHQRDGDAPYWKRVMDEVLLPPPLTGETVRKRTQLHHKRRPLNLERTRGNSFSIRSERFLPPITLELLRTSQKHVVHVRSPRTSALQNAFGLLVFPLESPPSVPPARKNKPEEASIDWNGIRLVRRGGWLFGDNTILFRRLPLIQRPGRRLCPTW